MAATMLLSRAFCQSRRVSWATIWNNLTLPTLTTHSGACMLSCVIRMRRDSFEVLPCASFHTTANRRDLLEFLDDSKNWGEGEVRSGRSWRKEEMRIKSNSDLHKLWYVLLKERNMLLTMQHECKRAVELFPNPERLDKVEESMSNLEEVVRERNRAYYELETGFTGERPTQMVEDVLGRKMFYRLREYPIPHYCNKKWRKDFLFNHWDLQHVIDFKRRLREKELAKRYFVLSCQKKKVQGLIRRFPHVRDDALQDKFPDIDVTLIRKKLEYNEGIARN